MIDETSEQSAFSGVLNITGYLRRHDERKPPDRIAELPRLLIMSDHTPGDHWVSCRECSVGQSQDKVLSHEAVYCLDAGYREVGERREAVIEPQWVVQRSRERNDRVRHLQVGRRLSR